MSDLIAERAALLRQVAELQAEVARLQAAMAVPNGVTNQDWGSLDGVVAWHLIDRHAENWADIGRYMDLWLAARSAAAVSALQSEVEALRADAERLNTLESLLAGGTLKIRTVHFLSVASRVQIAYGDEEPIGDSFGLRDAIDAARKEG